jgi:hypothetical protein
MTLADGDATFDTVTMGASSEHGINWDRLAGLTDLPRLDSDPPDRIHDPAVPAWAQIGWRQVTASNMSVKDPTKLLALRTAMTDRVTIRELVFHDSMLSDDDLMLACVADRCEYDKGAVEHSQGEYEPSLQWLAGDPTIFSDAVGDLSFGGSPVAYADLTVTNEGTFASPSGRAWTLRIQAHGPVVSPYIRISAHNESITWRGLAMTSGQVLTVDEFRSSWIGSEGQDGYVRSDDSDFPNWPILRPGVQTFRVGCVSGLISGNLHPRSTW